METTRKKALAVMQKGMITYKLLGLGWDLSEHFGDGYDMLGEKHGEIVKVALKAIDLSNIQSAKNVTQHITANEIINATHLIITIFDDVVIQASYIMTIPQFIEKNDAKKAKKFKTYEDFFVAYIKPVAKKFQRRKKDKSDKVPLDFSIKFYPGKKDKWRLEIFKEQWENLNIHQHAQKDAVNLLPYIDR